MSRRAYDHLDDQDDLEEIRNSTPRWFIQQKTRATEPYRDVCEIEPLEVLRVKRQIRTANAKWEADQLETRQRVVRRRNIDEVED